MVAQLVNRGLRIALPLFLALALAACGGKKEQSAEDTDEQIECEVDDDCPDTDECKRNVCVEREIRRLRRQTNTVTPESVRRKVQERQKHHERRVDKSLDL